MPTFGNTGAGTQSNFSLEGNTFGSLFTLVEAGLLTSMTIRLPDPVDFAPDATITGRIYADSAGTPGAKLGSTTSIVVIGTSVGPQTCSFSVPLSLAATNYWLCFSAVGTSFNCRGDSTSGFGKEQTNTNPDPFAPTTTFEGTLCIYATYILPGGPGDDPPIGVLGRGAGW